MIMLYTLEMCYFNDFSHGRIQEPLKGGGGEKPLKGGGEKLLKGGGEKIYWKIYWTIELFVYSIQLPVCFCRPVISRPYLTSFTAVLDVLSCRPLLPSFTAVLYCRPLLLSFTAVLY